MKHYFSDGTQLHITDKHTGKMKGMMSLSTSMFNNEKCEERRKHEEFICHSCYAPRFINKYKNVQSNLERNQTILSAKVYPVDEFPFIPVLYFRLESFGDLSSENQFENYLNLCLRNPKVNFALWTKNPIYIHNVLKRREKPENLVIILSSVYKNKSLDLDRIKQVMPYVDKIFTVYNKKYIKENNVEINCEAKNCFECHKCYEKNGINEIKEQIH